MTTLEFVRQGQSAKFRNVNGIVVPLAIARGRKIMPTRYERREYTGKPPADTSTFVSPRANRRPYHADAECGSPE